MLHINRTNYKKPYNFPQISEKITEFSQNFQKNYRIFTKFSEKITIKLIYIVSILTKNL